MTPSPPACLAILTAALSMSAAFAFPDGAPWGAANPAAAEDCASCHFGADPVHGSEALSIVGLPDRAGAGESYELVVRFEDEEIVTAGFQLFAAAGHGDAGTIVSSTADVEFAGAAIRSTAPVRSPGSASWTMEWRAPAAIDSPIVFFVAASAANDDGSPLGDTIHYEMYSVPAE